MSPLLQPPDLTSNTTDISVSDVMGGGTSNQLHASLQEVTNHILAASHVMHIVAMEMYYSFQ